MHLEGAIVLGTGGDNSNASIGSFFEGVVTSGEPADAADDAVQANIVAAGYSGNSGGSPAATGGTITLPGGQCVDVDGDGTTVGTEVELWDCNDVGGQVWQQQSDGLLFNPQSGLCLETPGGNTANGTQLQIDTCNGSPAQKFSLS
jgi:hypothetical protein